MTGELDPQTSSLIQWKRTLPPPPLKTILRKSSNRRQLVRGPISIAAGWVLSWLNLGQPVSVTVTGVCPQAWLGRGVGQS